MSRQPTALQLKLANQILSHARSSGWRNGHHLTEDSLQPMLGASRTPIRAAMAHLASAGILERRPNRGYFLKALATASEPAGGGDSAGENAEAYLAIAIDRLNHRLPDVVSENELIRRYDLSRARLRHTLARIAAEGWIERRPGRGWAFQPLIDTLDAYRENYRFRQIMEPAAMRSPDFAIDQGRLRSLRDQQTFVLHEGYRDLGQIELFELHSAFHEGLAAMSNNRFFVQTLARLNQLRRLMEYGRPLDRERVRRVCLEHLGIIERLGKGDREGAADRLRLHLTEASVEKALSPAMGGSKAS